MKLLKIFGLVLALHVVLVPLLFLSPGCQSASPKNAGNAPATDDTNVPSASAAATANENWSTQSAGTSRQQSQIVPEPVGENVSPVVPLSGPTPAERERGTPMRPDNPDAYISTTTPAVLAPSQNAAPAGPTTYTIRPGDALVNIAKRNGTTVSAIIRLNPGIKPDALHIGQQIKIPGNATAAPGSSALASEAAGVTSAAASSTYKVRSGDTLSTIAARNGTTVAALRKANNLRSDVLQIDQTLTIPAATRGGTTTSSSPAPASSNNTMTVELKRGETLSVLAQQYGITVNELIEANHIADPRKIRAGQMLIIPGYQAVGGSGATKRPATNNAAPAPRPPANTATPNNNNNTPPPAAEPPPSDNSNAAPVDLPPGATDAPVVPVEEPTPQP